MSIFSKNKEKDTSSLSAVQQAQEKFAVLKKFLESKSFFLGIGTFIISIMSVSAAKKKASSVFEAFTKERNSDYKFEMRIGAFSQLKLFLPSLSNSAMQIIQKSLTLSPIRDGLTLVVSDVSTGTTIIISLNGKSKLKGDVVQSYEHDASIIVLYPRLVTAREEKEKSSDATTTRVCLMVGNDKGSLVANVSVDDKDCSEFVKAEFDDEATLHKLVPPDSVSAETTKAAIDGLKVLSDVLSLSISIDKKVRVAIDHVVVYPGSEGGSRSAISIAPKLALAKVIAVNTSSVAMTRFVTNQAVPVHILENKTVENEVPES